MKILVISDLHIGKKANTKDLYPYSGAEHKDDKLVSSFFETVKEYILENGDFEYLIIPGDVTNSSNLIEYEYASTFFKRIEIEINIKKEQIIFVPGNHDVDWSVFDGDTIFDEERIYRKRHKYNTLLDKEHEFSKLAFLELLSTPYLKIWDYYNAIFVGYNSSWQDDKLNPDHYGYIEQEHIKILNEKLLILKNDENYSKKLKFFIVHHHLQLNPNPHPLWKDLSCMQNSVGLINLLTQFSFNFIVHGHRHVPYFYSTNINSSETINFLSAGSYSCEIPTNIAGSVGNLFHIIKFDDLEKCKGQIISKAYDPTKLQWVDSKENHGIRNIDNFGNEMKYNILFETCKTELSKLIQGQFKQFKDLINLIPDLKYLQNTDKDKLINELNATLGLSHSIAMDKEIIFIKK